MSNIAPVRRRKVYYPQLQVTFHTVADLFWEMVMLEWVKKFILHHVLNIVLLLVLCAGIFPFVILYASSMVIARMIGRMSGNKKAAEKCEALWDMLGKPYDFLVKAVG